MSSMSAQEPKSPSLSFFRKLFKIQNKNRKKGISKPARDEGNPDISIPAAPTSITLRLQPADNPEDECHLDTSALSQAPSTTVESQPIDKNARGERALRNPDISTQAQASTTPRPQPVNHCSGDEGHSGVPVLPRGTPTISKPPMPNREPAQDSKPGALITSPSINHSHLEAKNEDDNGISNPIKTLLITPEHPSIDYGGGDVQNVEVEYGVDPDLSIPRETPTVAAEPCSVVCEDGDMGSKAVPSISMFQRASNFQITNTNINTIGGNATIIRFGDGQFTEIQRNLICDYIANLTVLPDIKDNLEKHVLTQSIIFLPRAKAMFDDYQNKKKSGPCFKGTREALLREMADWATSPGESRMYVLSGLAGIGKSTVAYTIASRAADLNLLGASFFFSRDEPDRKNAERFFTTIAYQFCVYNKGFAKAIGDVLLTERGSAATTKDPQVQLQVLIVDPLRSIVQPHSRPILIVVDALDECDEEDGISVLAGLRRLVQDLPSFKVILTTRPQPYLDHFLRSQGGLRIFHLQNIEDKIVDGDIRLYLQHFLSLEQVRKRYPRRQWCASDKEINSLVHAAGRLFIIASTTVRYIFDKSASNPAAQMQKLLNAFAQAYTPFKDLDHFYTIILRNVVPANCDDDDIVDRYRSVIGAIISVQRHLPVSILAHLINIDVDDIHAVLDHLQSVILLDDDVPRIYHKSFPDYLTDQTRCKDHRLWVDLRIRHIQIAVRCFEIMDNHLKYNILGLGNLARFMSNEAGLEEDRVTDEQLEEKIPQLLRYACVYWVNHLQVANIEDAGLMNGLEKFADEHMLYWFEVLSLIGNLDSAHLAIRAVMKHLKSTSSDLRQLLSDALRFISKFYGIIKRSALHMYYSALPFTPTNTLLYRRYSKETAHSICSIEGVPEKWDAHVANLNQGEDVTVIKFSLDSALFVSSSEELDIEDESDDYEPDDDKSNDSEPDDDKSNDESDDDTVLKIWDAVTGIPISTISGHKFAVANDFSIVASSRDNIITLYSTNGSPSGTMFTSSSRVQKLALSSESSRIAAASADGTVRLWDSGKAELIDNFDAFGGYDGQHQLEFSPTGTRLAYSSGSPANSIKLRDGISGRFIADLQWGSDHKFEFSGDGSRIASMSSEGTENREDDEDDEDEDDEDEDDDDMDVSLTLWNSESGGLIGVVRNVGQDGLAISANGSLLATADYDRDKVTLWSGTNDSLAQIKVLEVDDPCLLAFSLDNLLAIATGDGIKLYSVKTHSLISKLLFSEYHDALAFSPDCTRLAVGDGDNVNLWDIRGIDASGPPSEEHPTEERIAVSALALSRDCSRLACGFDDGTVELWETSPTKRRTASHQLHKESVGALGFGPDGRLFASGSDDGTTKLWDGKDGSLRETLDAHTPPSALWAVTLSNSVLVEGHDDSNDDSDDDSNVTLLVWSLESLSLIHTFEILGETSTVSIAENGTLIAIIGEVRDSTGHSKLANRDILDDNIVSVLDVVNHTTIATFDVPLGNIHTMTFLPDNSHLVVQSDEGDFLTLNLVNKRIIKGHTLEHLIQLPNTPLWHGVPIWHCQDDDSEQHYFAALFPEDKSPVPVLWIPREIPVATWTQGSSIIALGCEDGRVFLLRISTSHVS